MKFQKAAKILWVGMQCSVLLTVALSGMAVFVAAIYYWIELTLKHHAVEGGFVETAFVVSAKVVAGNLFLVVLVFMGVRIAWIGWTSFFKLFDKITVAFLLDEMLQDQSLPDSKQMAIKNRLLKHLMIPVMDEKTELRDGTQQLIDLVQSMTKKRTGNNATPPEGKRRKNSPPQELPPVTVDDR